MIRSACLAALISLSLSATSALAGESQKTDVITASALMDRLLEQGLLRPQTDLSPRADNRQMQSDQTCSRRCDANFVKGYESCRVVMAKLSPPADLDTDSKEPSSNICGQSALSGLSICQSACSGSSVDKEMAQTSALAAQ